MMIKEFKEKWEIQKSWQFIYPLLGIVGLVLSSAFIVSALLLPLPSLNEPEKIFYFLASTAVITWLLAILTLWLFKKLRSKWEITYRYELIAIFIVFAITGSLSARLSEPVLGLLGISKEEMSGWIFWPLRLLLIFPIYQLLLVAIGWLFGQFKFFWKFEKRMLRKFGIELS